jgi:hypothetical protein
LYSLLIVWFRSIVRPPDSPSFYKNGIPIWSAVLRILRAIFQMEQSIVSVIPGWIPLEVPSKITRWLVTYYQTAHLDQTVKQQEHWLPLCFICVLSSSNQSVYISCACWL